MVQVPLIPPQEDRNTCVCPPAAAHCSAVTQGGLLTSLLSIGRNSVR